MAIDDVGADRTRAFGLVLLFAVGMQLWITTWIGGYELQVLTALLTMGLTLAAVVVLFRSLEGIASDG
ncbi:hypothetical protein [Halostagnicola bangensis]